jgi:hypothetical protein
MSRRDNLDEGCVDFRGMLEDHGYPTDYNNRNNIAWVLTRISGRKGLRGEGSPSSTNELFQYLVVYIAGKGEPFSGYSKENMVVPHPDDKDSLTFWGCVYE